LSTCSSWRRSRSARRTAGRLPGELPSKSETFGKHWRRPECGKVSGEFPESCRGKLGNVLAQCWPTGTGLRHSPEPQILAREFGH
jgi:hypothetical protein